jgi:RNA-directed DNA polymerase
LLHHALYRELYPFFDRTFIADSYSCRSGKGTHKAIKKFWTFSNKVSKNNTKTVWVLKGDIKKFFANIDHDILKSFLQKYIPDENISWLLNEIIDSFHSKHIYPIGKTYGVGLPLGNLTSQLLVNIYMNEFDQFVKHKLKAKYYIRYADDFVIFSQDKKYLENILEQMKEFLENNLKLTMHPDKVFMKTIYSGVDFLGWVHFPDHRVLRTSTKRKMYKRIEEMEGKTETVQSYLGLLSHGNAWKISNSIKINLVIHRSICLIPPGGI